MATVTYTYTGVGDPSTVRRLVDAVFDVEFPQDPGNREYQTWQVWVGLGGTTGAAPTVTLADRKAAGKLLIAGIAAELAALLTGTDPRDPLFKALRFAEAQRWEDQAFASPGDDAEAPLLAAEVDSLDLARDTVDEIHDLVLAELATLQGALADIAVGHADVVVAIDAATDQEEIDAAIAAADFDGP